MSDSRKATVTRLLEDARGGDRRAVDGLFEVLYGELREIAGRQRKKWQGNHTLDTSALLHEAYVRLVGQEKLDVDSRAHFRSLAARAMRHILCDYARDRAAQKRGGGQEPVALDGLTGLARHAGDVPADEADILVALDAALRRLEAVDERRARVVEMRFFGDLSVEETAAALDVSARTVKRDWAVAQAWLHREMSAGD